MNLKGVRTLVVGLKKSGVAAVELLRREGAVVRTTDLKPLEQLPDARGLDIPFERQSDAVFEDCELIVLSPDVPADLAPLEAARRRGVTVIGDVELAAPYLKGRIIGITGSNGKTTTTSLTGHILREAGVPVQVGGNIGVAVAGMVDSSREDGWSVLELSSFQLETIREFRVHVAALLNVTQNHLDRHHTFENYAAAKGRIFENQQPGDLAILNADDPVSAAYAPRVKGDLAWFGSRNAEPGATLSGDKLVVGGKLLMTADEVLIRGRHNLENVLAASLAAMRAGVGREAIAAAVRTFRAVEHRLEFVRRFGGIDFYNDSKATSVDATLKALDAFSGGLWVILGGKDKGLDYRALREPLAAKARAALLIGAAAEKIGAALEGSVPLVESGTLGAAVAHAVAHGAPGDTVLLAPACASFDQFTSFEHRGEVFKQIVQGLEGTN
ncbi:MAG: UDP-N-acetylmuramoyl-L-alanine--D-glutamate ligase [Acidobacteria bacterium]|nr:UDP-N-acetylmuramoyl-L-alanine--D-glutamate ligase [Acidobacteriota bacterium]